MAEHNDLGRWDEDKATEMLQQKRYIIMCRNWRYGRSKVDLDIVCKTADRRYCVFVEVKTRRDRLFADPEDAVNIKKMRHLGRAAHDYIRMYNIVEEARFDVVTIVGTPSGGEPEINHIEDAFNPLLI